MKEVGGGRERERERERDLEKKKKNSNSELIVEELLKEERDEHHSGDGSQHAGHGHHASAPRDPTSSRQHSVETCTSSLPRR